MDNKIQVAPIYSELQGYLSQAPDKTSSSLTAEAVWERYNQTINELNSVSGNNYNDFLIKPKASENTGRLYVDVLDYRGKLGGIIGRLYREFFSDEIAPFSGMPSTIINQSQHQSQSIHMLLEIQSKIDEQLFKAQDGSKEKTFLEKVKTSLSSVNNVTVLMSLIMKVAKEVGLTINELTKLFI